MAETLKVLAEALQAQQQLISVILEEVETLRRDKQDDKWIGLKAAVEQLGPAFSSRKIADDIKAGLMKHGIHFIDTSNGAKPVYAVKVSALRKLYGLPPEKRKRYS